MDEREKKKRNLERLSKMFEHEINTLALNPEINVRYPVNLIISIGFSDGSTHVIANRDKKFTASTVRVLKRTMRKK